MRETSESLGLILQAAEDDATLNPSAKTKQALKSAQLLYSERQAEADRLSREGLSGCDTSHVSAAQFSKKRWL